MHHRSRSAVIEAGASPLEPYNGTAAIEELGERLAGLLEGGLHQPGVLLGRQPVRPELAPVQVAGDAFHVVGIHVAPRVAHAQHRRQLAGEHDVSRRRDAEYQALDALRAEKGEVDRILDKISQQGMDSLTERELKILRDASRN